MLKTAETSALWFSTSRWFGVEGRNSAGGVASVVVTQSVLSMPPLSRLKRGCHSPNQDARVQIRCLHGPTRVTPSVRGWAKPNICAPCPHGKRNRAGPAPSQNFSFFQLPSLSLPSPPGRRADFLGKGIWRCKLHQPNLHCRTLGRDMRVMFFSR